MSAVRAFEAEPNSVLGFRLVAGQSLTSRRVAKVVIFGIIAIVLNGLLLNVLIAQGAYEMASLKNRTKELTTTSQVIQQQVGSLASNQNLEQAAHDMGMVANSNPVFLSIQTQKIFGHPVKAKYSNSLGNNLVANSLLTEKTDVNLLNSAKAKAASLAAANLAAKAKASSSNTLNVAAAKPLVKKVSLPSGGIPGSPTH
ncbi:MAG: hypothetical protein WCO24_04435 [Actinomycetes bacterium]